MNRIRFLKFWSIAVGGMDTLTGLLLMFVPLRVISLLGIAVPSADALNFLSWIGAFVCGVGLSYGMALGEGRRGETVWAFTSGIRAVVSVFLIVKISTGSMAPAWALVAASDGAVAVFQTVILRLGWWKEVGR